MKNNIQNIPRQEGAALVVGLIVLLIMTLLGISSMSLSISELKMANNLQMQNLAFQSALSAVELINEGDSSANAAIQALKWNISTPQSVSTVSTSSITSGSVVTSASILYVGCMNAVEGYDLSGSDQEGGSGAFKGKVYEISATSNVMSGTSVLSAAGSLNGKQVKGPGCPP